jgi:1,4-dihydroxy-2-naphthoate octaprenyltransferase
VQTGTLSAAAVWASIPIGLLATAILVVNNLRDIETDRRAGKRTLAVRLGRRGAQIEYVLLTAIAYLIPLLMWLLGLASAGVLLSWLSLLMLPPLLRLIFNERGKILNQALAKTARLELVFAVLFSVGIML